MKKFIITIDTEGDNLWNWKQGDFIFTHNAKYLLRFQELCNKYDFKPTWLTNYEMITDSYYLDFIKHVEKNNQGELGMHLHAWNTPPKYQLNVKNNGAPYLIEYPEEIMEQKIATMTNIIVKNGIKPISHRAGRWATNQKYFDLLIKYGYKVDCSVTPHINWKSSVGATEDSKGSNYVDSFEHAYWIKSSNNDNSILEVPMTVLNTHSLIVPNIFSLKEIIKMFYGVFSGKNIWLRPNGKNLNELKKVIKIVKYSQSDYLMFMIHSSELMPGGSPTFKDENSIEVLYRDLECIFNMIKKDFKGVTLRDYYEEKKNEFYKKD